jgi:methylmalonyl-CoA/ethylmalonyl-CoA epimerase
MKKLEHIGIAVKNLEESEALFAKLLGTKPYKRETVESEQVTTSFFQIGEIKIELLSAINEQGPIAKFIEKKGEGIHHLAFETENIIHELAQKKEDLFEIINQDPKDGADNKLISFLHPRSTNGVLIELCQEKINP